MKVLVAENNAFMLQQLCELLEKEGYDVLPAASGREALDSYHTQHPDFICLDILMDDISGHDVCREIRKTDSTTPVVFITSKDTTIDKVIGLELGADDYIVKPFDIIEVTARIRAITRRCLAQDKKKSAASGDFTIGRVIVHPDQLRIEKDGQTMEISVREAKILILFNEYKGKVVNRDLLLDRCWGTHIMPESRTVDWHISQLRKKIEDNPAEPVLIRTLHGAGYKYDGNTGGNAGENTG